MEEPLKVNCAKINSGSLMPFKGVILDRVCEVRDLKRSHTSLLSVQDTEQLVHGVIKCVSCGWSSAAVTAIQELASEHTGARTILAQKPRTQEPPSLVYRCSFWGPAGDMPNSESYSIQRSTRPRLPSLGIIYQLASFLL